MPTITSTDNRGGLKLSSVRAYLPTGLFDFRATPTLRLPQCGALLCQVIFYFQNGGIIRIPEDVQKHPGLPLPSRDHHWLMKFADGKWYVANIKAGLYFIRLR